MPHALAAHLAASYFDATAITNNALVTHALVLATIALPILGRTKDFLAEEPLPFGLKGAIVDGLRLLDFTLRPFSDLIGRR